MECSQQGACLCHPSPQQEAVWMGDAERSLCLHHYLEEKALLMKEMEQAACLFPHVPLQSLLMMEAQPTVWYLYSHL